MNHFSLIEKEPQSLNKTDCVWYDSDQGELYLDMRSWCGTFLCIADWRQGLSTWRWDASANAFLPEIYDPGLAVFLAQRKETPANPILDFAGVIPALVREALAPFLWRQFVMLQACRSDVRFVDLVCSNPCLAWLLAEYAAENEIPASKIAQVSLRKRREILGFLGFRPEQRLVDLLAKIRFLRWNCDGMALLEKFMLDEKAQHDIRSAPSIVGECLRWAMDTPELCGCAFFRNAIGMPPRELAVTLHSMKSWYEETLRVAGALAINNAVEIIRSTKTIDSLIQMHDRWTQRLNRDRDAIQMKNFWKKYKTEIFPEPPVAGTPEIEPVRTMQELQHEGAAMCHCAASYADQIMSGDCYLYRVLKPQRATLEIVFQDRCASIRQIRLAHNGDPSRETVQAIQSWLDKLNKSNKK